MVLTKILYGGFHDGPLAFVTNTRIDSTSFGAGSSMKNPTAIQVITKSLSCQISQTKLSNNHGHCCLKKP